jgi:NAD(P)-dependent dehydrogenase (short-subunit alcohol dehydrogenase family)
MTGAPAQQAKWGGQFRGKVAMVTGAASGIGRAAALALAREGALLVLADQNQIGLDETLRLCGEGHLAQPADVTDGEAVAALTALALARFGRLDCAVNAAGISGPSGTPLAALCEQDFDRVFAINAKGVWLCMKHQIDAMLAQGGGAIVNVASGAAHVAVPGSGAYVGSKHAVLGLTKAAAADYAGQGIRVNAICPGFTRTPMAMGSLEMMGLGEADAAATAPIGRIGEAEEQANAILFLLSDNASFMAGHGLVADGGHSIV